MIEPISAGILNIDYRKIMHLINAYQCISMICISHFHGLTAIDSQILTHISFLRFAAT